MAGDKTKVKKHNWIKIQTEYEAGGISYAKLAIKHRVSENTIEARARREKWKKGKAEIKGKVTEKIREKTIEKISDGLSTLQANAKLIQAAMVAQALEAVKQVLDANQWAFTHAVKIRTNYGEGQSDEKLESVIIDAANTKAIKDIMDALGKGQEIQDKALEYETVTNRKKYDIEREKLNIEKKKIEKEDENDREIKVNYFSRKPTMEKIFSWFSTPWI